MNEPQQIQANKASSMKMLRAMVGIGVMCALMIVLTYEGTFSRIKKLRAEALEKAIFKVVPGMVKKQTFQLNEKNAFVAVQSDDVEGEVVYAGYNENDQLVGVAVKASGMGFADVLRILYGYDVENQTIVGFYVLESKETPGLGDKIEKDPNFLENFKALDVSLTENNTIKNKVIPVKKGTKENPWEVDCITGATISSRAIGNIIGESTERLVPLIYKNKALFETEKNNNE